MSRNQGFGLIEIMVGLVVGLISMIVVMQVGSVFEGQKRAITSGGDAQTNGALGLYALEREIRVAGNAMTEGIPQYYPLIAGCNTEIVDTTSPFLYPNPVAPFQSSQAGAGTAQAIRLAPVLAMDGGGGASDALTITYGTSTIAAPYVLSDGLPYNCGAGQVTLESASGINVGDMVVVAERDTAAAPMGSGPGTYYIPAKNCSLHKVTAVPPTTGSGVVAIANAGAGARYNGCKGTTNASVTPVLYDLGPQLNVVTYRIENNNLVADISQFGSIPDGTANGGTIANRVDFAPLASNIVNMQVQYGVDTTNPMGPTQTNCKTRDPNASLQQTDADSVVDQWVEATGPWAANTIVNSLAQPAPPDGVGTFNLWRIRAVRIGLVARSSVKEPPNKATGLCDATADAPRIRWNTTPTGPDMMPDLTGDPDWRCYRYKVFQATIPVRNALWSSGMNPASSASCGLRDPA